MSWALRFRRPSGQPAKLTLGHVDLADEPSDAPVIGGALTLGQARELAANIARQRARGLDVIEEHKARRSRQATAAATAAANGFMVVAREFFVDHKTKKWQQRPRHWRAEARLLGLDYPRDGDPAHAEPKVRPGSLAATWADKPVTDIDGHDIHTVVDEARKLGLPGLPRRNSGISEARGRKMHAALSNLFRWAQQQRKVTVNPTIGVWHPGAPPARERVLTEAEVKLFWHACEQIGAPYGPLFQLLALTGQRLAEVTGITRAELSEDGTSWTIPGSRTKNHRTHLVPLPPLARAIIERMAPVESPSGYVFTISGKLLSGFSKAKVELDQSMATLARAEGRDAGAWRLHDLRRTCATGMADMGILPHVVEAVLNHVSGSKGGVAGVYNRAAYAAESKAALERWAVHVEGIVSGQPANVVAIRRPAGAL
jgi:integrase